MPLQPFAFLVLYVATLQLLESEVSEAARRSATDQLALMTLELNSLAMAHSPTPGNTMFAQPSIAATR